MTSHTIRTKGQEMFGGEYLIKLQVTIAACLLVKWRGVSEDMAILAYERRSIGFGFMRGQLE